MIFTQRMALLFLALAVLNELIWRNMSEETWVYFKTFSCQWASSAFSSFKAGCLKNTPYGTIQKNNAATGCVILSW